MVNNVMLKKIIKHSLTMLTTAAIVMASGTVSLVSAQSLRVGVGSAGSASAISAGVASSKSNTQAPKRNLFSSSSSGGNNSLALRAIGVAHEPINYASLGYTEEVEDLRVKVHAGYVKVRRTYKNKRWYVNRRWSPLKEVYETKGRAGPKFCNYPGCGGDGSLKLKLPVPGDEPKPTALSRNGYEYKRVSDSLYVFGQHQEQRITKTETGYRWENTAGDWIEYDQQRRATRYGGRNPATFVRLQYDGNGFFSGVFDALDQQVLWVTTNAKGHIESIRDKDLRTVSYSFVSTPSDVGGAGDPFAIPRLSTVTDVRGNIWTYQYDSKKRLHSITDPEQRIKSIIHHTNGAVFRENVRKVSEEPWLAVGNDYYYEFNEAREELYFSVSRMSRAGWYFEDGTPMPDSGGLLRERWFNTDGIPVREDMNGQTLYTTKVENNGRKRIRTEFSGSITVEEYDTNGNMIKQTLPDGSVESWRYNSFSDLTNYTNANGVQAQYIYNGKGQLQEERQAVGSTAQSITRYEYDTYGNVTKITDVGDATTAQLITTITYDNYGNAITIVDPDNKSYILTHDAMGNPLTLKDRRGHTWTYTYDAAGSLLTSKNPLLHITKIEYDKVGNAIKMTDPENNVWSFTYDARDNLRTVTDPLNAVTRYNYNLKDQLISTIDPSWRKRYATYDAFGRPLEQRDDVGNSIKLKYHEPGNAHGANIVQAKSVEVPGSKHSFLFDKRNRPVQTKIQSTRAGDSSSYVSRNQYDVVNNITGTTDAEGNAISMAYDARHNLLRVTNALNDHMDMTYDARDNLLSLTAPGDRTTLFAYDGQNRLQTITQALGQITTLDYDEEDNLTEVIDANGSRLVKVYDEVGRMTQQEVYAQGQTVPQKVLNYSYDKRGLMTGWQDGSVSATLSYDKRGYPTGETINYGSFSLSHSYTYYANGLISSFTGPDSITYTYQYDKANRLIGIDIPGLGRVSVNEYDWFSPKKVTFPGGSSQVYDYNALYKPNSIALKDPAGNVIAQRSYTYDLHQNIIRKNLDGIETQYHYDDLYQLTQVMQGTDVKNYRYDATGNISTETDTWVYDDNNRLTSRPGVSYEYNNLGAVTRKTENAQVTDYIYDLYQHLVEIKVDNVSVATYGYGPFDRRLWKEVNGTRTYYHYSANGLVGEYNNLGQPQRSYGYVPGSGWGMAPVFQRSNNQYYFYHTDHLGTPQAMISVSGMKVWEASYSPMGHATVNPTSQIESNLRWPGQYHDAESGLHYNFRRYYDPDIGRYLQVDPLGLQGGLNLYGYAAGNPINYTDPTGEFIPLAMIAAWAVRMAVAWAIGAASSVAMQYLITGCVDWQQAAMDGLWGMVPVGILMGPVMGMMGRMMPRMSAAMGAAAAAARSVANAAASRAKAALQRVMNKARGGGARKSGAGKANKENSRGGPPRDSNGNYIPDPRAEGAHTTLGTRTGRSGSYTQGATFDKNGTFRGRTDVTSHGRGDHTNPHWHPATGPNSVKKGPNPIPDFSKDPGFNYD